jgi:hypothetical protein
VASPSVIDPASGVGASLIGDGAEPDEFGPNSELPQAVIAKIRLGEQVSDIVTSNRWRPLWWPDLGDRREWRHGRRYCRA